MNTTTAAANGAPVDQNAHAMVIKVHPVVLLSITDHNLRLRNKNDCDCADADVTGVKKNNKSSSVNTIGVLLGKEREDSQEKGKQTFSIVESFEMVLVNNDRDDNTGDDVSIDKEFVQKMRAHYKETFEDLDCVGWYHCFDSSSAQTMDDQRRTNELRRAIHEQVNEQVSKALLVVNNENENNDGGEQRQQQQIIKAKFECPMVFLAVDARVSASSASSSVVLETTKATAGTMKKTHLPAKMYRFDDENSAFSEISYTIDANPAERVAVEHASKATTGSLDTKESRVLAYLQEQRTSVKALRDRVSTMLDFLETTNANADTTTTEKNDDDDDDENTTFEILRRINAICAQKNTLLPNEEKDYREKSDAMLVQTLSQLTKACADTESFARKFNAVYKRDEIDIESASGGGGLERFGMQSMMMGSGGAGGSQKARSGRDPAPSLGGNIRSLRGRRATTTSMQLD